MLLEDGAPPPLAVEAARPLFDVAVLAPPDDDALEDCAGAAALPLCGDEESVRVGVLSGSVPQEEEVVTPPVALGDTEQGIPCRRSAGSVDAVPAAGAALGEVRFDEGTPGEGVPPDALLPGLLS